MNVPLGKVGAKLQMTGGGGGEAWGDQKALQQPGGEGGLWWKGGGILSIVYRGNM